METRVYIPIADIAPGTRFLHLGAAVTAAAAPVFHGLRAGSTVTLTDGRTVEIHSTRVALLSPED